MPAQEHPLDVRGYRNDALAHIYRQQETPTGKLGLLLPGMGYGLKQPGLKYAASVLDELGLDTFGLETRYHTPAFADASADEAARWLKADVLAAYRAAQAAQASPEVCIVGKSLGTLGMHLLLGEEALPGARLVWLTPLLGRPEVLARILERAATSLVVIGTLDPHFSSDGVQELRSAGAELLLLEDAHHNLSVQGDTVASLRHLHQVMQSIRDFVA